MGVARNDEISLWPCGMQNASMALGLHHSQKRVAPAVFAESYNNPRLCQTLLGYLQFCGGALRFITAIWVLPNESTAAKAPYRAAFWKPGGFDLDLP